MIHLWTVPVIRIQIRALTYFFLNSNDWFSHKSKLDEVRCCTTTDFGTMPFWLQRCNFIERRSKSGHIQRFDYAQSFYCLEANGIWFVYGDIARCDTFEPVTTTITSIRMSLLFVFIRWTLQVSALSSWPLFTALGAHLCVCCPHYNYGPCKLCRARAVGFGARRAARSRARQGASAVTTQHQNHKHRREILTDALRDCFVWWVCILGAEMEEMSSGTIDRSYSSFARRSCRFRYELSTACRSRKFVCDSIWRFDARVWLVVVWMDSVLSVEVWSFP